MGVTFRPAIRENVPLLIGLAGGTGSGKTFSALKLATGMAGGKPFCLIDTEAGRAKHYADQFTFDHGDMAGPFTPDRYADSIHTADQAGYPVIVVDSMSHVWAGDGGCLDMQEAEFQRMGGREAVKMASWIKPKSEHKRMVSRLLQVRAHLILCFRAEPKVEMRKDDRGKMQVVEKQGLTGADGWFPICEKSLPFELTLSVLLLASKPGVPVAIKLQEQHRSIVSLAEPLSEAAGQGLAAWAAGGKESPKATTDEKTITEAQARTLTDLIIQSRVDRGVILRKGQVTKLSDFPASKFDKACDWLNEQIKEAANA